MQKVISGLCQAGVFPHKLTLLPGPEVKDRDVAATGVTRPPRAILERLLGHFRDVSVVTNDAGQRGVPQGGPLSLREDARVLPPQSEKGVKSGKCECIKAQITPDQLKRSFWSYRVPVSLANPLELGRNQAGKQGSHPCSRDEGLGYSSQPNIDVVRRPVELQKLLRQTVVVHHRN